MTDSGHFLPNRRRYTRTEIRGAGLRVVLRAVLIVLVAFIIISAINLLTGAP